jgi:hypothetical protein
VQKTRAADTPKGMTSEMKAGVPCIQTLTDVDSLADLIVRDKQHDCEGFGAPKVCVKIEAVAELPTRFGSFRIVGFWNNRDGKEHIALVHGDVLGKSDVLTRLHSECLTGDALGSLRCDCRDQLAAALERIAKEECGVLLYLRQEDGASACSTRCARTRCKTAGSTRWTRTSRWAFATTSATTPWPRTCSRHSRSVRCAC